MKYLMFANHDLSDVRNSDIADSLGCGPVTQSWYAQRYNADGRTAFAVDSDEEQFLLSGERDALQETIWQQVVLPYEIWVDVNGSPGGDGTEIDPTTMSTAFTGLSLVAPGSTIHINPGVYSGDFAVQHNGNADSHITIIFADGAKILGSLTVYGSYCDIYYPVCYGEPETRYTSEIGSNPAIRDIDGIVVYGSNTRIIHPMVHDRLASGASTWQGASNSEVYGLWAANNGWTAPDRGHGHGLYAQNETGTKTINGCIFAQGYSGGLRCYGNVGPLVGFRVKNCVSILDNPVIGGHSPASDIQITDNCIYGDFLEVGETDMDNEDVIITGNYIVGSPENIILTMRYFHNITLRNNIFVIRSSDGAPFITWLLDNNPVIANIDNNTYFFEKPKTNGHYFILGLNANTVVEYKNIAEWQAMGYDQNSQFIQGLPTQNFVRFMPSEHDNNRGSVVIYNWQNLQNVNVDLSGGALTPGNTYRLYNAQNPGEYHEFIYDGNHVSVPMTGWTVSQPYNGAIGYGATWPDFAAFILMPA